MRTSLSEAKSSARNPAPVRGFFYSARAPVKTRRRWPLPTVVFCRSSPVSLRSLLIIVVIAACFQWWRGSRAPLVASAAAASELPSFEFSDALEPAVDPLQGSARGVPPVRVGRYVLKPIATFQVAGRVLGAMKYSHDREAELAPVDLAMGWGPMTNPDVLRAIDVSQGGRFYRWRTNALPIPAQEIVRHSANMHLVPASEDVARELRAVRAAQTVRFKGYLLEVSADDGWRWKSSTTRADQGAGACELVLVDALEVL